MLGFRYYALAGLFASVLMLAAEDAEAAKGREPAEVTSDAHQSKGMKWKVISPQAYPVQMEIPTGEAWKTHIADGSSQQGPAACAGPRRSSSDLILVARHQEAKAGISLERVRKEFVLRNREDLRAYMDERITQLKEASGKDVEIQDSEIKETGGEVVYRLGFTAPLGAAGGRGCGGPRGGGEKGQFVIQEHYLRTPDSNSARVYRTSAMTPLSEKGKWSSVLQKAADSFTFTEEMADSVFLPEISESTLPSVDKGSSESSRRTTWLVIGGLIIAVTLMWHMRNRSKSKSSPEERP